jgi:hypothetical protein
LLKDNNKNTDLVKFKRDSHGGGTDSCGAAKKFVLLGQLAGPKGCEGGLKRSSKSTYAYRFLDWL